MSDKSFYEIRHCASQHDGLALDLEPFLPDLAAPMLLTSKVIKNNQKIITPYFYKGSVRIRDALGIQKQKQKKTLLIREFENKNGYNHNLVIFLSYITIEMKCIRDVL